MEATLNMRSVTRFLVLVGSVILWLVLLTILNLTYLRVDHAWIVVSSLAVGLLQTVALALLIHL